MSNEAGRPPHKQLSTARRYSSATGTSLAVFDGDKSGSVENARETKAAAAAQKEVAEVLPRLPEMSEEELEVFAQCVEQLYEENRFKRMYANQIWLYSNILVRVRKTVKDLNERGFSYQTYGRNGTQHKRRPEAVQLSEDMSRINNLCSKFGFTPLDELRFTSGQPDLFGAEPFPGGEN